MEKKELINKITDFSSDLMEKHFPKGECKERGQALVFNAEMIVYISDLFDQELDKAREEGRREGSEITSRYISDFVKSESGKSGRKEILEYIEELSKLKQ